MKTKKTKSGSFLPLACVWLAATATGLWFMFNHEFEAGSFGETPTEKPSFLSSLSEETLPLTLVISVHPDCPCTGASIEQLERLLVRNPNTIRVVGLIQGRNGNETSPPSLAYENHLESLPNAIAMSDPDGAFAAALGNLVSGAIVAYDQRGKLRFQGGLTASRGHAGSSIGMDLLESLARGGEQPELCKSPVFGCTLQSSKSS